MEEIIKRYLELVKDESISTQLSHRLYEKIAVEVDSGNPMTIDSAMPIDLMYAIHYSVWGDRYQPNDDKHGLRSIFQYFSGYGYLRNSIGGYLLPINDTGQYIWTQFERKSQRAA